MNIVELSNQIKTEKNVVFLGGAGISTASGIPDFRGEYGAIHQITDGKKLEQTFHTDYITHNPIAFYQAYQQVFLYPDSDPNFVHYFLAQLEKDGYLNHILTQNVDGFHQVAGSQNVTELHGYAYTFQCSNCYSQYDLKTMLPKMQQPFCDYCDQLIKPDVVLFGESSCFSTIMQGYSNLMDAELLIIGGTSLLIQDVYDMVAWYLQMGKPAVIINKQTTPFINHPNISFYQQDIMQFCQILSNELYGKQKTKQFMELTVPKHTPAS